MTTLRLSDTRPTIAESARQLWDGLRVFGVGSQPVTLARIVLGGLPRHGMTVAGAVSAAAKVRADQVALVDGRGAMTYAELGRAAERLAAALDHHGLAAPGTGMAVICHDDRDLFIAAAAGGLTGARVSQLSPRMGRAAFDAWLEGSRVDLILHAPEVANLLGGFTGRALATTDLEDLIAATPAGRTAPVRSRQSASVMVTSGTTGVPKGVAIRRRADQPLAAVALAGATRIRPGAPTLVWPPLYHGYGLAAAMLCLVVGSPVITASALPRASLADGAGEAALAAIRQYGVEVVFGVPAQLRALAGALDRDRGPAPRLRAVLSGSDSLDPATVAALQRAVGPILVNFYGSTEAGTFAMANGRAVARDACVGRPIVGTRIRVVGEDGVPTPAGVPGRIQVQSLMASLADEPGSRWLTMGDRGYLDEQGRLHVLGRAGTTARLGGEFVEPEQVRTLLAGLPGVVAATVEVVADDLYGRRLTASVRLEQEATADPEAWREIVRASLGPAAVPREVSVLTADEATAPGR